MRLQLLLAITNICHQWFPRSAFLFTNYLCGLLKLSHLFIQIQVTHSYPCLCVSRSSEINWNVSRWMKVVGPEEEKENFTLNYKHQLVLDGWGMRLRGCRIAISSIYTTQTKRLLQLIPMFSLFCTEGYLYLFFFHQNVNTIISGDTSGRVI